MCLPLAWTSLLPQPCLHNWHVLSQCGVSQHTWPVWCCTTLVGLCIGQLGQGRACLLTCLLDGCAEVCNVLMSVSTQTSGAAVAVAVEHHKLCRLAVPCKTWCVQLLRQLGMQGHLLQLQAWRGSWRGFCPAGSCNLSTMQGICPAVPCRLIHAGVQAKVVMQGGCVLHDLATSTMQGMRHGSCSIINAESCTWARQSDHASQLRLAVWWQAAHAWWLCWCCAGVGL